MDEQPDEPEVRGIARRRLLSMAGGAALALGTGGLLAGCNSNKDDGNGNSVPFNGDGGANNGGGGNNGGDDSDGGGGGGGSGGGGSGGGDDSGGGGVGGSGGGGDEDYRSHQGVGTAWSGLTG
jgi:hypothetical protein